MNQENYVYELGVIGAGTMGAALVRGFVDQAVLAAEDIIVSDIDPSRLRSLADDLGVAATADNAHGRGPTCHLDHGGVAHKPAAGTAWGAAGVGARDAQHRRDRPG